MNESIVRETDRCGSCLQILQLSHIRTVDVESWVDSSWLLLDTRWIEAFMRLSRGRVHRGVVVVTCSMWDNLANQYYFLSSSSSEEVAFSIEVILVFLRFWKEQTKYICVHSGHTTCSILSMSFDLATSAPLLLCPSGSGYAVENVFARTRARNVRIFVTSCSGEETSSAVYLTSPLERRSCS